MPDVDMPNTARISGSIPRSNLSSVNSDSGQLTIVALFSGLGLLVTLIAILCGVQGAWY
jgi:hypothetical protein